MWLARLSHAHFRPSHFTQAYSDSPLFRAFNTIKAGVYITYRARCDFLLFSVPTFCAQRTGFFLAGIVLVCLCIMEVCSLCAATIARFTTTSLCTLVSASSNRQNRNRIPDWKRSVNRYVAVTQSKSSIINFSLHVMQVQQRGVRYILGESLNI